MLHDKEDEEDEDEYLINDIKVFVSECFRRLGAEAFISLDRPLIDYILVTLENNVDYIFS